MEGLSYSRWDLGVPVITPSRSPLYLPPWSGGCRCDRSRGVVTTVITAEFAASVDALFRYAKHCAMPDAMRRTPLAQVLAIGPFARTNEIHLPRYYPPRNTIHAIGDGRIISWHITYVDQFDHVSQPL